jgi:hypothetical protein
VEVFYARKFCYVNFIPYLCTQKRAKLLTLGQLQVNLLGSRLTAALSKDKSTNVDMKRTGTINNALNISGLT